MEQEICICEYCNRPIKNLPHSKSGHYRNCKQYKEYKNKLIEKITYDFLYTEYVVNEKSMPAIAYQLGLKKFTIVHEKLKEFGFHIRTLAETRKTKGYIESTKNTCRTNYGTDYHTCKNSSIRKEISIAVQKKYNVVNVFQLDWVQNKSKETTIKNYGTEFISQSKYWSDAVQETCRQKYGYDNVGQVPKFIQQGIDTKNSKPKVYTQSSKKADDLFIKIANNIHDNEHVYYSAKGKEFGLRNKETGRYYYYDFVDTEHKKCIEFNGNYFHANPLIYEPDIFIKKRQQTAKEIWASDFTKLQKIENEGYTIKIVWESEYDETPEYIINECIAFLTNQK